ncbi:MAG: DUF4198 domain-containing protein [Ascidiaceihabitans sp.]|nr:DUF4198 domain-containing protein [Ascidiaceihabitans sp.]
MNLPQFIRTACSAAVLGGLSTVFAPTNVFAHEFWIEPEKFQVETGDTLVVDLRNGQEFAGSKLAYFENSFTRFDVAMDDQITPVDGRMGDRPAMQMMPDADGLLVILHETTPAKVRYKEWPKFLKFAAHKDFADIESRHDALGFARDSFRESYTRHAKALVAVGDGTGSDRAFGLKTEFVALSNPYAADFDGQMQVQVLLDGAPRTDAQIEVFHRATDGSVTITLEHTDDQGRATIPVIAGDYLFDAVVLQPFDGTGPEDVVWQTFWAALTFHVD